MIAFNEEPEGLMVVSPKIKKVDDAVPLHDEIHLFTNLILFDNVLLWRSQANPKARNYGFQKYLLWFSIIIR